MVLPTSNPHRVGGGGGGGWLQMTSALNLVNSAKSFFFPVRLLDVYDNSCNVL